jgi:hypothetical protein
MVIKKLIAISVVFALVAGAAFAVDLGGEVIGSVNIASSKAKGAYTQISGTPAALAKMGDGEVKLFSGGSIGRSRLEGSGEADIGIGTIGGWLRFDAAGSTQGKAWWQPIEQLRIQLGHNGDGEFDTSHIGRYGFYAQANELSMVNSDGNWGSTSFDSGVFGGYSDFNFALIITPMDGVSINVALPWNVAGTAADKQAAGTFKQAFFQANYNADFGAVHVTYQGINDGRVAGKLWGSAYLGSLVDGLGLEFGVGFVAHAANPAYKDPLSIALAVKYDVSEQFGVKLRSIFDINMNSGATDKVALRVDVLPFYAINENVTAYLDAGMYLPSKSNFIWHFNPYVRIGSEWGAGFYVGFNFNNLGAVETSDGGTGYYDVPVKSASGINFSIPIGIIAKF